MFNNNIPAIVSVIVVNKKNYGFSLIKTVLNTIKWYYFCTLVLNLFEKKDVKKCEGIIHIFKMFYKILFSQSNTIE
jgi:hypothetical protein